MKLKKWGNSIGIRVPKVFAVEIGLEQGDEIDVELHGEKIVISNPGHSLASMLRQITTATLHYETNTGSAVGKELW